MFLRVKSHFRISRGIFLVCREPYSDSCIFAFLMVVPPRPWFASWYLANGSFRYIYILLICANHYNRFLYLIMRTQRWVVICSSFILHYPCYISPVIFLITRLSVVSIHSNSCLSSHPICRYRSIEAQFRIWDLDPRISFYNHVIIFFTEKQKF